MSSLFVVHSWITGKHILVTGAGGSIASALCARLLSLHPASLHLLGLTEHHLVETERQLRPRARATPLRVILGNVADTALLARVMPGIDVIIHAAAHKHVPLGETCPAAFVATNVGGTRAVLAAARRAGVARTLVISTDKAVQPVSVMGATKALAERLVTAAGPGHLLVRFGNVLDSSGSVLPLWRAQIAQGGPLTLTDPACTRYFMSIDDACTLILATLALDVAEGTFVLDMGHPHNLLEMAEGLIAASGQSCLIQTIGLRPGEKLTEELAEGERTPTAHSQVLQVDAASPLPQDDVGLLTLLGAAQGADDARAKTLLWSTLARPARAPAVLRQYRPKADPITFVTWKWRGTDPRRQFLSEHVNVLAAMLARHYHAPYKLVCLTDDVAGLDGSIEALALPGTKADELGAPRHGPDKLFPACYRRLWLFSEAACELGVRLVNLDIDVIILDDITALIRDKTAQFVGWCDPRSFGWSKIAGGFWALTAGSHTEIWDDFSPETSPAEAAAAGNNGSDQAYLSWKLYPPKQMWTARDGIVKLNHLEKAGHHPPPWVKMVFTIGLTPPWSKRLQIGHRWVTQHWTL